LTYSAETSVVNAIYITRAVVDELKRHRSAVVRISRPWQDMRTELRELVA
jgi:hypothetical protein